MTCAPEATWDVDCSDCRCPLSTPCSRSGRVAQKFANGVFECETLDGWDGRILDGEIPERVRQVIRAALPFPATITAAKTELDYWVERDRELEAMYDDTISNSYLSLSCQVRSDLVRDAFETGIRARSVEEIEIRQRYLVELECSMPKIERAVLLDL